MDESEDPPERSALTVIGPRRRRSREPRVESRDFRRPARPTGTQLRELEALAGRIGAQLRGTIANRLKTPVECVAASPEVMAYGEAVESLPAESWLLPLISEGGDRALMAVDVALQRHLVVRFLGGGGRKAGDAESEPEDDGGEGGTNADAAFPVGPVSRAALLPILRAILKDIGGMLRDETSDEPTPENDKEIYAIDVPRLHTPPRRWLRSGEAMTALEYSLRESGGGGAITFVVPSAALTALLRVEETSLVPTSDAGTRRRLESMVRDLGLAVSLRLGSATIDLAEFLRLGPGDVLVLDRRVGESLDVLVGTEKRFVGQPGRSRGRLAVRIIGRNDHKEES